MPHFQKLDGLLLVAKVILLEKKNQNIFDFSFP